MLSKYVLLSFSINSHVIILSFVNIFFSFVNIFYVDFTCKPVAFWRKEYNIRKYIIYLYKIDRKVSLFLSRWK